MGDEFVEAAYVMLPDGDVERLAGAVGLCSDVASPEQGVSWSGSFTVPAELNGEAFDAIVGDRVPRSCVIEIETGRMMRAPGPSRFMRRRRIWQCGRGRWNANVERRKLARKKSHLEKVRNRIVFPSAAVYGNYETNEVVFEIDGGAGA